MKYRCKVNLEETLVIVILACFAVPCWHQQCGLEARKSSGDWIWWHEVKATLHLGYHGIKIPFICFKNTEQLSWNLRYLVQSILHKAFATPELLLQWLYYLQSQSANFNDAPSMNLPNHAQCNMLLGVLDWERKNEARLVSSRFSNKALYISHRCREQVKHPLPPQAVARGSTDLRVKPFWFVWIVANTQKVRQTSK